MKSALRYVLVALIALIVGLVIGLRYREEIKSGPVAAVVQKISDADIREAPDGISKLTSPLLECAELPESVSDAAIAVASSSINALIATNQKNGNISYASVYYRDLNNGPWLGINESDSFFPASLLKLPLAMSFYDHADSDPGLLSREIEYKPDPSITSQLQPFGGADKLVAGKKYTVQYLIDFMLKESSNEAANTLAQYGGSQMIDDVYHDFALTLPTPGQDYSIDTHKYASFFRILYNATYIDRDNSEKILKTLTEASFAQGLVAGVPHGVVVAHKFGTREVNDNTVQLHDCGIVYAPGKPYVLCVMTQGTDFTKLAGFISQVSSAVYGAVTTDNK